MLSIFKFFFKRLFAYPIIIYFDRKSDKNFKKEENEFISGGYLKLSLDKIGINSSILCPEEIFNYFQKNPGKTLREFNQNLLHKIVSSPIVIKIVKNYIGENARIDDFYIKCATNVKGIPAESWHHDNVGYRIKLFCILHTEGNPAATKFIPTKRPNLMKLNLLSDIKRFSDFSKNEIKSDELSAEYQEGDILFFDSNNFHRGAYSDSKGKRIYMCIEFIDKDKSNKISGFSPCGPGQNKQGELIIKESEENLSTLFDRSILFKKENYFSYSIKNKR